MATMQQDNNTDNTVRAGHGSAERPYTVDDFSVSPLMFYYEVTNACDLVCKHCRASAQEHADADELTHAESLAVIEQVATFPRKPHLVFTGGDPLKRPDLFSLIRHATSLGLPTALTPSATPLATREAFSAARDAGIQALGISLDAPTCEVHDAFRGFTGSFAKTLEMLEFAASLSIPVQVNTSITRRNVALIDDLATLLAERRSVAMWSLFFLVPTGRGVEEERITAAEYETVFEKLWNLTPQLPFGIKTTEAPHYRRYVLERGGDPLQTSGAKRRAPLGVTDGRGVMFVGCRGEVYPAGFLPLECGRVPRDNVVTIYQTHPTFRALQNPDNYRGACGRCEYRAVCGGSRARAYAVTGDPLQTEPDCVYAETLEV
ncbi:MAG: TIGR04053 family radical SAM/SPASM domain-containing protein [Thermoguttaceae bacterium]